MDWSGTTPIPDGDRVPVPERPRPKRRHLLGQIAWWACCLLVTVFIIVGSMHYR